MSEKRRREKRRREVGGEKKDVEVEVDPYRVLGLPSGRIGLKLSQAEIEEAYERKCFEWEAKEKFLGYPDTSAELLKVEDAYKFLQSHKRRGEFYYRLRTTIERENLRLRRRTTAGRKLRTTAGRMKLKVLVNREYKNLLHTVNELQNKLNKLELETPKSSGSSDRLKGYEDKLMRAEERMSKPNDPSSALANLNHRNRWFGTGKKTHLLFEFSIGYALFYARNFNEIDMEMFESAEKYINSPSDHPPPLVLEAFHLFSSSDDALVEMNAISESAVTEQLKSFLLKNLPEAVDGKSNDFIATCDPHLSSNISKSTNINVSSGTRHYDVMRAFRMDLYKFIDLHPGDLVKAQVNLAHLYSKQRQRRTTTYVGSSMVVPFSLKVAVVPHKFEGLFIAKGRKDIICTKNLVCGEALPGEDLISVENEDGTKVQYRVWNPNKSKLAAAIQCGVTNIWVKPGSRVLYVGDLCGITICQLSDLVGPDGLVYVVGLCDNIVNLAERRSNVVTVLENPKFFWKYRMVVGMVDVIFADMAASHEVKDIFSSAGFYLSAGGHYMIATQASDTNLTSQDLFAGHRRQREFKHIELVTLEPIKGAYVMYVGGFRVDI